MYAASRRESCEAASARKRKGGTYRTPPCRRQREGQHVPGSRNPREQPRTLVSFSRSCGVGDNWQLTCGGGSRPGLQHPRGSRACRDMQFIFGRCTWCARHAGLKPAATSKMHGLLLSRKCTFAKGASVRVQFRERRFCESALSRKALLRE